MATYQRRRFPFFSVLYWITVALYFVGIRYVGLGMDAPPGLDYTELLLYGGIVGCLVGLLFGRFPLHHLARFRERRSFLAMLLMGTVCYCTFFLSVIFLASLYGNSWGFACFYAFSPNGLMVLFHFSVASLLYHFILQINRKFGPGLLREYTVGKYFAPKVEARAFLFLDLISSTTLAESLDHVEYSRMIQDCYAELTQPLIDHKAQVYQYVGDEVVLSWKMDDDFSAAACYGFFYDFRKRIEERRHHFLSVYGVYPRFKAGLHCGQVTVAEVGEIKTEIAYHGDVVNTASRIQHLCHHFEMALLVSESVLSHLPQKDLALVSFVADITLRGKESATRLYTIADPELPHQRMVCRSTPPSERFRAVQLA